MSKKRKSSLRATEVSRCWFEKCHRPIEPGDKIVLMVTDYDYMPMHKRHAKHLNFVARARLRWAGPPSVVLRHSLSSTAWAQYSLAYNAVLLPAVYGDLSVIQRVYVLGHEMLHWVLSRDLGLVASHQLDGLVHRPLRCLGGLSLYQFEVSRLHHDTANL